MLKSYFFVKDYLKIIVLLVICGLITPIGIQDSFGTLWDYCSVEGFLLNDNPDKFALVEVTITHFEIGEFDPPKMGFNGPFYTSYSTNYDMEKVVHGNKNLPLSSVVIKDEVASSQPKVGEKYLMMYYLYDAYGDGEMWNIFYGALCIEDAVSGPIFSPLSFLDDINIYLDLRNNPCSPDKEYLIKKSTKNIVCVTLDTKED
ncbi:MAG: hypothetical protein HRO68_02540 [Nitrosopumilus sp.]|nr:hypothetical protein [Nitrosopumilus sp.]